MRFGSLFAGIGGFDLALERVGMQPVFNVEIDKKCRQVLARHWPDVPQYEDVTTFDGREWRGEIDLLCGGFPCQDLSVAGKRAGLEGARSGLFFEFARIIQEINPKWIIIENVPGLLSSAAGRDFGTVLGTLDELGYGLAWRVLDAQYAGVAQRRRRVFIVGHLGNYAGPREVLLEPGCVRRDPPTRRSEGSIASAPSASSVGGADDDHLIPVSVALRGREGGSTIEMGGEVANALQAAGGSGRAHVWIPEIVSQAISSKWSTGYSGPSGDEYRAYTMRADAMREGIAKTPSPDAEGRTRLRNPGMGLYEGIAPTLDTSQPHGVYRPDVDMTVRRLTPTECARLQGFPDNWLDGMSDTTKYKMIGNAVAVPVVEWIAKRILDVHP